MSNYRADSYESPSEHELPKMSWIFLVDNSGSMKRTAMDVRDMSAKVKESISEMLPEIEKAAKENAIQPNIRIFVFHKVGMYAVGNAEQGENITDAIRNWRDFELVPDGFQEMRGAIEEACRAIWYDRNFLRSTTARVTPAIILMTDGMIGITEPVYGDGVDVAIEHVRSILGGNTIRVSLGLRHHHDMEKDLFASQGSIAHSDGSVDTEIPFSIFVDEFEYLPTVCKQLAWDLSALAASGNQAAILDPAEYCQDEDDDWED